MPRHPPCALLRLISKLCSSARPALEPHQRFGFLTPVQVNKDSNKPSIPQLSKSQVMMSEMSRSGTERLLSPFEPSAASSAGPTRCSRKEVIQPQVPLRLPCYDFAPVTELTFGGCPLAVSSPTSGPPGFHGVTGGVYKARERIHRGVADPRLLAIPASCSRVADCNPNLDQLFAISALSRVGDALYWPL
jgi:hypothetical protein